jgi:hypothetical protein
MLFCNCNSSWENMPYEVRWSNFIVMHVEYCFCDNCHRYFWYDAEYDNMIFDLRNMNN